MKLGSLKSSESKDGLLIVVDKDQKYYALATHICPSLLSAVEKWNQVEKSLQEIYESLNSGTWKEKFPYSSEKMLSALPRTWLFADGSSFLYHVKLVRKARNAPLPETLYTVPLIYQGECGQFLSPTEDIPQVEMSHGTDFEGEVGVIVSDVPMGVTADDALKYIKLVVLINDVSLRGLIPDELASGFGFFQSKPTSSLSPLALTLEEFGQHWKNGRLHLPLDVKFNGAFFGSANAGEMHFHFGQLIAHAARTRRLVAGTLIGSGTVSNDDHSKGSSCLAEKRMIEQIEDGKISTSFMKVGDQIEISMKNSQGKDLFGVIKQRVALAQV